MAIASCSVKIISRGKGLSVVAGAAYRSGEKLSNSYDGLTHNYTRKTGVVYKDILTPPGAPEWTHDRQQLWNRVEEIERRKDAQLAREVMIALPRELSPSETVALTREYAQAFVRAGMIADVSIHDPQDGNPHAHILLTLRPLKDDGFGEKCRNWNSPKQLVEWRKNYETITNQFLERAGREERIDVRSYEVQGIDRIPTIHLGHYAHRLEQRGIHSDRGDINREIEEQNRQIIEINSEIAHLKQEAEYIKSVQGSVEYSAEKEQDEPFHHGRAADHSRKDDVPDAAVTPYPMGAEEEQVEIEEPLRGSSVEDLIGHYTRALEDVKKTAETVGVILTEKGKQSLIIQQRNIENVLEKLKQQEQKLKEHPAPVHHSCAPPLEGGEKLSQDLGIKDHESKAGIKQQELEQPYLTEGFDPHKIRQTDQSKEAPGFRQPDRDPGEQQGQISKKLQEQPKPDIARGADYQNRPPPFRQQWAERRQDLRNKEQGSEPPKEHGRQVQEPPSHDRLPSPPGRQRHFGFGGLHQEQPSGLPEQESQEEPVDHVRPPSPGGERKPGFRELRETLKKEHTQEQEEERNRNRDSPGHKH